MNARKRTIILLLLIMLCLNSTAHATFNTDDSTAKQQMTTGQAIILGIVEGLTEYLPVSSTGHLLLAERIMGIGEIQTLSVEEQERNKEAADAYAICIQAGAIIAVPGLYFRQVLQMLQGLLGRNPLGLRLFINVVVGFLPAVVLGLLFNKIIKEYLFGPWPVVVAWLLGGLAYPRCQLPQAQGGPYAEDFRYT